MTANAPGPEFLIQLCGLAARFAGAAEASLLSIEGDRATRLASNSPSEMSIPDVDSIVESLRSVHWYDGPESQTLSIPVGSGVATGLLVMASSFPQFAFLISTALPTGESSRPLLEVDGHGMRALLSAAASYSNFGEAITQRQANVIPPGSAFEAYHFANLTEYLGNLVHDLNNQVTVISGFVHLLQDDADKDSPLRSVLENIAAAAERIIELTKPLRKFQHSGRDEVQVIGVDAWIADAIAMIRYQLPQEAEIRFSPGARTAQIEAEPVSLLRTLLHLCRNAVEAMGNRGLVEIRSEIEELSPSNKISVNAQSSPGFVIVSVLDSGRGLSDADFARAFEPFYTSQSANEVGGLGLTLARRFAERLGGSLGMERVAGGGCAARLRIPIAWRHAVMQAQAAGEDRWRPKQILIVEDDATVREYAAQTLKSAGYEVVATSNPNDAAQILSEAGVSPALTIADVVMPGSQGNRWKTEAEMRHPHMRWLFISGYERESLIARGLIKAGFAFLKKPFTPEELRTSVSAVLEAGFVPVNHRVLVVDDDEGVREFLVQTIQSFGFQAESAKNGAEALGMLKQQRIDVLITDLVMPGIGGLALMETTRLEAPGLPVIVISGSMAAQERLSYARDMGATAVLAKPVDPQELIAAVYQAVGADFALRP